MDPAKAKKPLSDRERQILLLAADGCTDKGIANELGIAVGTVQTYWERMREKMQASTRAEIIAKALGQAYREAEESLFETSKWLQILIDCAEDYALFFIDADLKISSWNPGVLKILGYPEDEFVGRPFEELFVDAERAAGIPALEQKSALDTGRALDRRWHRRADGSLIYVTGNLIPLKRDDKLIGYAKIMRDDTYTNQLEEEIAALRKAIEPGIRV